MGNCVTVYKNKDPAAMNLSAQIQSPTKENHVRRELSIAEFYSRPQLSSTEQEASFRDLRTLPLRRVQSETRRLSEADVPGRNSLGFLILDQYRSYEDETKCYYNHSLDGKTEEMFFDSQPWLESDCEDFFSVNGDSTSSSGNSPNHQNSFRESSVNDKNHSMAGSEDAALAQSPTDIKKQVKQLIELFRESFDDNDAVNNDPRFKEHLEDKPTTFNLPPFESIPNSARSSEATPPYRGSLQRKEKSAQSAQCCLPSLVRNMSFGERKKRLRSPAPKLMDDNPDIYSV